MNETIEFHDAPVNGNFTKKEFISLRNNTLWRIERITNLKININQTTGEIWYQLGEKVLGKKFQSDSFKKGYSYIVLSLNYKG